MPTIKIGLPLGLVAVSNQASWRVGAETFAVPRQWYKWRGGVI